MIMTAYSTWSPQWSETEHEVFRDFGFAAFEAQMLEAALVTFSLPESMQAAFNSTRRTLSLNCFCPKRLWAS